MRGVNRILLLGKNELQMRHYLFVLLAYKRALDELPLLYAYLLPFDGVNLQSRYLDEMLVYSSWVRTLVIFSYVALDHNLFVRFVGKRSNIVLPLAHAFHSVVWQVSLLFG